MTEIFNALHGFLAAAGVPVYPESGIPEGAALPYLTYTPVQTPWDESSMMQVRIWDRSTNYTSLCGYAEALRQALGEAVTLKAGKGGYIHLAPGNPFAQPQPMQDSDIKVLYVNIEINTMIP